MNLFTIEIPYSWQRLTAAQLSDSLTAKNNLTPTGLTDAFTLVSTYGADETEQGSIFADLLKVYGLPSPRFMDDLQAALHSGDGRKVAVHAQIGAALLSWSALTQAALASVIGQLTIAPTAAEVTAELEIMGFSWDGGAWVVVDTQ